jgi:hypothetical protein
LLVESLAKAQAEIKAPDRNRTVNVTTRDQAKSYAFKYATLDHIIEVIRAPLTKNGLWFTQIMKADTDGTYILDTRLLHSSGQWLATQVPLIVEGGSNQQFGSALTFMRRYALTSLLGIAAEEDDDANTADGNTVNQVQDRKPVAPKPDVMETRPDPISSGPMYDAPSPIPVPMKDDESGSDWVAFGKELIAAVKGAKTSEQAEGWNVANSKALDEMSQSAPKLYANLNSALIKAVADLKRKEAK